MNSQGVRLWVEGDKLKYEAPPNVMSESLVSEVRNLRAELMTILTGSAAAPIFGPIAPRKKDGDPPLSYAQQRLWLLTELNRNSAAYNVSIALALMGELRLDLLEKSIDEIVRRHEVLRSNILSVDGQPRQIIHQDVAVKVKTIDLRQAADVRQNLEARLRQYAREPFILDCEPLLRVRVFRISEGESVLLITAHHVVADLWSMEIFAGELSQIYSALQQGRERLLAELPIQYGDFAAWQRELAGSAKLQQQVEYWRERLHGAPELLSLPTDFARPKEQTFSGAVTTRVLSKTASEGIVSLAQAEGCTLFMAMLTVFQALLGRYSGQADICVGTPVANRSQRETQGLIGFFLNTLVLRTDLSADPSFLALLRQTRQECLNAYDNQDVRFETVLEAVQPGRDASHHPLFQVMLVVQSPAEARLQMPGLVATPIPVENQTAKFDLTLFVIRQGEHLHAMLEYNTDLFREITANRLLESFSVLLQGAIQDPECPISQLSLISAEECAEVYAASSGQAGEPIRHQCLHRAFAAQAVATPDAIAIQDPGHVLTYKQLNRRANQIAHYLLQLGLRPEMRVGICLRRSTEMMVAILAVLKAGGVYIPLDPAYPPQRLRLLVEESRPAILLTHRAVPEEIDQSQTRIVPVEDVAIAVSGLPDDDPQVEVSGANLAYIIFTSGSTGRPKGVMVTHTSIMKSTAVRTEYYGGRPERFLLLSSSSFDSSLAGMFWTLNHGGTLCLPPEGVQRDTARVATYIENWKITHTLLVPSLYRFLLEHSSQLGSLQCVIVAGEACPEDLRDKHQQLLPHAGLTNEYGPTEAAVWTSAYKCTRGGQKSYVPIGRAIPNMQVLVLDRNMGLVPTGVAGELYAGGIQLSRGYFGEPSLTAEKFVPDPYGAPGARLYRTGDLGRYRDDGNLEFLGRADHQVKVRGYRIELGEVEAALLEDASIREAAVAVVKDGEHGRLVAYIVPRLDVKQPSSEELRARLRQRLPEYMVPVNIVRLTELPVNANGKLDRSALPQAPAAKSTAAYEAPRDGVEKILAEIWQQVLKVDKISVHDNFFELGGDSILSIQVVARANQRGLRLSPAQVFQQQTIAALARVARQTSEERPSEDTESAGEVPLSPIQQWFFESCPEEPHHFNQSVLLETGAPVSAAKFEQALRTVIAHHSSLSLRFQPAGGGAWRQYYGQGSPADERLVVEVDLSEIPEFAETAQQEVADDLQASLNLQWGPLIRAAVFKFAGWNRVLVIAHHLVIDGVSWRILLEDLLGTYTSLRDGQTPVLPARTASFQRWVEALMELGKCGELAEEIDYWKETCLTNPARLPSENPGGRNNVGDEVMVLHELSSEETRQLLQEIPEAYGTRINDVLLAALAGTLGEWSGERTLLVDLEGHGRESHHVPGQPDISRTVGWFTTLYPVVLEARRESEDLGEHIKRCKERNRKVPRNGLGFGVLSYFADREAKELLNNLPRPEICFNYLGQWDGAVQQTDEFRPSTASHGRPRSPRLRRKYLLDVTVAVGEGRLVAGFTFSCNQYHRETIDGLAASYIDHIRGIIAHCLSEQAGGYTPSDFPLANLTDDQLSEVLQKIAEG